MNKPRWTVKETKAMIQWITYVIRDENNYDNFELFMVRQDSAFSKFVLEGCIEATRYCEPFMDKHSTSSIMLTTYHHENKGYGVAISIQIPSKKRCEELENQFELFAEILMMNNISFWHPNNIIVGDM